MNNIEYELQEAIAVLGYQIHKYQKDEFKELQSC